MSLRRIAPRLLSRCNVSVSNGSTSSSTLLPNRLNNATNSLSRRGFSSPTKTEKKLTAEEMEATLEKANESMKAYYSYPPDKLLALKKKRFEERHKGKEFYFQVALGMGMLCTFIVTPFLGRKIALDEEFKKKYVPEWYDFSVEKPKSAWTKEELHQQVMTIQRQLHERAIAGEFTPEKLEGMRRNLQKKPPEEYAHFSQLHPGVDDDEELEDD